jgi:hypothetical protein
MECSRIILDERLQGIPIHYSTTYRDDPEGVAIRQTMADEKRDTLKQLKDMSDDKIKERGSPGQHSPNQSKMSSMRSAEIPVPVRSKPLMLNSTDTWTPSGKPGERYPMN